MPGLDFSLEPGIFTLAAGFFIAVFTLFAAAFVITGTSPFAKAEGNKHKHRGSRSTKDVAEQPITPVKVSTKQAPAAAKPVKAQPAPQKPVKAEAPKPIQANESKAKPAKADAPAPKPAVAVDSKVKPAKVDAPAPTPVQAKDDKTKPVKVEESKAKPAVKDAATAKGKKEAKTAKKAASGQSGQSGQSTQASNGYLALHDSGFEVWEEHGYVEDWNVAVSRKTKAKFSKMAAEKADVLDGFSRAHAHHIDHTLEEAAGDAGDDAPRIPTATFEEDTRRFDAPSFFSVLSEEGAATPSDDKKAIASTKKAKTEKSAPKVKHVEVHPKPVLIVHDDDAPLDPNVPIVHPPHVRRSVSFNERIKTISIPQPEE
eukprot:Opistho-2@83100